MKGNLLLLEKTQKRGGEKEDPSILLEKARGAIRGSSPGPSQRGKNTAPIKIQLTSGLSSPGKRGT